MQRRFSLLKQWSKEKFGAQKQTQTSDDFKALESEMQLRYDGLTHLYSSTKTYTRWLSKQYTNDQKVKQFPVGHLGSAMIDHGKDFDDDIEYGQCLRALGEVQERLERIQEGYLANVTSCWLESLEHSLSHISQYHDLRKKLESRRLAFDASRSQLQKSKKDDPRLEETVMIQGRQYAETYREVVRIMKDISDSDHDNIVDLTSFVGAQISYHDRCREALLSLRDQWPASASVASESEANQQTGHYRSARSLASTVNLFQQSREIDNDSTSEASSRS